MSLSRQFGVWTVLFMLVGCGGEKNEEPVEPPGPAKVSARRVERADPWQERIEALISQKGYKDWRAEEAHLSGALVDGVTYAVHEYVQVYASPEIATWLAGGKAGEPEQNAIIVALEFEPPAQAGGAKGRPLRARTMLRSDEGGSHDGWYWSTTEFDASGAVDRSRSQGSFGESLCFACHASADNDSMVFLGGAAPSDPDGWKPDDELKARSAPTPERTRHRELAAADPEFLEYYQLPEVPRSDVVPFPARRLDRVWAGKHAGPDGTDDQAYVTSDQCLGCHNATQLLSSSSPNMWYPEPSPETALVDGPETPDADTYRNFSPYAEWSASLNALSGRDPVWHAQVDFERKLRPGFEDFTTDTCFLCHGPMAQRQVKLDRGADALFTIDMFYAEDGPDAKYGALARDGVSCAVCHQIGSPELGVDPELLPWRPSGTRTEGAITSGFFLPLPGEYNTYTAMFPNPDPAPDNEYSHGYFGPFPTADIATFAMDRSIGLQARFGAPNTDPTLRATVPQISESKLCGSCHTVFVPALPVGYELPAGIANPFEDPHMKMSFEQTTYFEWRNSQYENEKEQFRPTAITCQGCHMASHTEPGEDKVAKKRFVNMESNRFPPVPGKAEGSTDFKPKGPIHRHVLLGINYFVFEMLEQFPDLLGTKVPGTGEPENTLDPTLNARDWIENHAQNITADVRITSLQDGSQGEIVYPNGERARENVLEVEVEVTNYAGHKFPTGAGFRRAFVHFEVLGEEDEVLWASGRTNALGLVVDENGRPLESEETTEPCMSEPHHQIITRQNQVQTYETRALSSEVKLQTTVLGIYYEFKDNRIPPIGYTPPKHGDSVTMASTGSALVGNPHDQPPGIDLRNLDTASEEATEHPTVLDDGSRPFEVVYDRDYWDPPRASGGQDFIRYRVPLDEIDGWKRVRAQLYYQAIPPYYLRDRFQTGESNRFEPERDMKRLIYMTSRLNLDGTPAEGWSLRVGPPAEKRRGDGADERLTDAQKLERLQDHYNYLDLTTGRRYAPTATGGR